MKPLEVHRAEQRLDALFRNIDGVGADVELHCEGDLHLRFSQGDVELLHVAQPNNHDFIFGNG